MAQGRSNAALSAELYLSEKTVEAHVRSIFTKLNLYPDPGEHRRVLAVLAFLRSQADQVTVQAQPRAESMPDEGAGRPRR